MHYLEGYLSTISLHYSCIKLVIYPYFTCVLTILNRPSDPWWFGWLFNKRKSQEETFDCQLSLIEQQMLLFFTKIHFLGLVFELHFPGNKKGWSFICFQTVSVGRYCSIFVCLVPFRKICWKPHPPTPYMFWKFLAKRSTRLQWKPNVNPKLSPTQTQLKIKTPISQSNQQFLLFCIIKVDIRNSSPYLTNLFSISRGCSCGRHPIEWLILLVGHKVVIS